VHDWGSALGFYWAQRYPERIKGLVYMEALVRPLTWEQWPEQARSIFRSMRSPAGEEIVLQKNVFVERILPASVIRRLGEEEMATYRRPYLEPGESRRPTLTWPREIPIEGEPADVVQIVAGEEVTVKGIHFVQEDSPTEIGEAIAGFLGRLSC
jgi:haloalkane dehalogenase